MNQPRIEVPMLQDYAPASAPPRRGSAPADARAIAGERLRARRRRVTRIRKRIIATALVTFAVIWAVIFVQLVSGDDPALSQKTAVAPSGTSTGPSSGSSSGSGVTSSSSGSGTTSSGSGTTSSGSGTTSAITTSQS